jgi:prepilin-type N-terminal cleavage/methylation domain-containing protein
MRRRLSSGRRGVTLLELLVVLVILGLVASIAAFAPSAMERPAVDEVAAQISDARREALRSGVSVTIDIVVDGRPRAVTALPDGSLIADPGLAVDRLSGRRMDARDATVSTRRGTP